MTGVSRRSLGSVTGQTYHGGEVLTAPQHVRVRELPLAQCTLIEGGPAAHPRTHARPAAANGAQVYLVYIGYKEEDPEPQALNYLVENLQDTAWWRIMKKCAPSSRGRWPVP